MDNQELITRLAEDARPVKTAPSPFRLSAFWIAGTMLYIAGALWIFGTRSDLTAMLHTPMFLLEIATLVAIILSSLLSCALLAYPDLYQKRQLLTSPLVTCLLLVLVLLLSWYENPHAPAPEHGFQCTIHITMLSLAPAAALFYCVSRLASTHTGIAGLAALFSAFSAGAIIARFTEQTDSIVHIVQWHYLPGLAVALLGIGLGRLLLKW